MNEIQAVQPAFVAYRAGDLRKAFKMQVEYHGQRAEINPMGSQGFHESLKSHVEKSLKALDDQMWNDRDILTFPTSLSDFATAVNSSEKLKSFLYYHEQESIGMLTASEARKLVLIRSFS